MKKTKMSSKRFGILAVALLLAMLLPSIVACKKDPAQAEESTDSAEITEAATDSVALEDLDFGGEDINILLRAGEQYRREWHMDGISDSLSQEIFYRNAEIEATLGVNLNFIVKEEGNKCENIDSAIAAAGMAGDGAYDLVNHFAAYATSPLLIEYYKDFFSSDLTYLNLDQPWWNQNFRDAAESFGKLYVMVGDVNLSVYDRAIVTYFNKQLCRDHSIDPEQLYADVLAGNWTYDMLYSYAKDIYTDVDGDEKKSQKDIYGLCAIAGSEDVDGFLYSFDCKLSVVEDDGTHSLVTGTELEKLETAYDKVMTLWKSAGAYRADGTWNNYLVFTEGRAMFDIDVIYHYDSGNALMRNMKDEYGMIPVPKYDTAQKEYYSGVQDSHNVMAIIDHPTQNYAALSAMLELINKRTYESVRPYYFEKMVKTKYLKDEKSGQVFDMIMAGTRWDWADVYSYSVGEPRNMLWRKPSTTQGTVSVAYGENAETITSKFEQFERWLKLQ